MQQFTVPQFIDVEDKVIGPLSVRQFILALITCGLVGISYKIFDFSLFLTIAVILLVVGGVFIFIKINGVPFHYFLLNILQTLMKPRLRLWHKWDEPEARQAKTEELNLYHAAVPPRRYTASHLNRLALVVDTRGYYSGEEEEANLKAEEQFQQLII